MAIFKKRARDKPVEQAENRTHGEMYAIPYGRSSAGEYVTERTSMQITAVYACVKLIAETMAVLPLHVCRRGKDGSTEHAEEMRLFWLLHDEPNPEMTSFTLRETLQTHLLLWGNAYAQIIRNGFGEIVALYPLMPNRMTVLRNESGQIVYQYQTTEDDRRITKDAIVNLSPREVWHIPGMGFDGLVGYSPIAMARNAVGLSMATEKFGSSFFANGAQPGGVLEAPGKVVNKEELRENWQRGFSGNNAHKVAVLEGGMKYHGISISPEDAQFLETRKFQIDEIARIFRVPPHMIGDLERSTFSNIEHMSIEYVRYTMNPWVVRWEQSMKRCLLLPEQKKQLFFEFNEEGLLRGDMKSRMEAYQIALNSGQYSVNDVLRKEDMKLLPAEEGGDLHLVNGNLLPLKMAGAYADKTGERRTET